MKTYDYEEDKQSQEQQNANKLQLQAFDDEVNFSKLAAELHETNYQVKLHESNIKKIQRQVDLKVSQSQLTETIALINAGIHTDPNLIKLLKTKEDGNQQEEQNKVKMNAFLFAKKLNQMSQSLSLLLNTIKKIESKVTSVEQDLNMQLNQKSNSLQLQLQQVRGQTNKQSMQLNQRMQLMSFELNDKMRDIDTKVNWKLNEFKGKIDEKINEQMVMIYLQNMQKKMDKNMHDFQIKSNIDPQRMNRLQQQVNNNRINLQNKITQCNYTVRKIKLQIEQNLVKLQNYSKNKIDIQKRLQLFNNNFMDVYRRVIKCQNQQIIMQQNINKLLKDNQYSIHQLKRINTVLLNIKISDDFQRMLEEMNPAKVLELQDTVELVKSQQSGIFRQIALAKRQIAIVSAKTENMGFLMPNKQREKFKKQQIYEALNNFLIQNQFAQKLSNLDKQVKDYKNSMDSIALLSRQVARLQKQSDYHRLSFQMKNLQQFLKKQIAMINEKIKQKYNNSSIPIFNNQRQISNSKNSFNDDSIQLRETPLGRSFSTKKTHNINSMNFSKNIQYKNQNLIDLKSSRRY